MKASVATILVLLGLAPFLIVQSFGAQAATHFDVAIAPLLARHCVECHGPDSKKGRLDLSNKAAAFAGGKNGKAIVAGNTAESLLWEYVQSDEMPSDRPPLSPQEKALLREWIEQGAVWSADENAPLRYLEERQANLTWVRRLTVPEYIETVRRALGVDVGKEAHAFLPPDLRADGFNNTAYNLTVDLAHIQAYARLAEIVVDRMDLAALVSSYSSCQRLDEQCMRELIEKMGAWVLRGPLDESEVESFLMVSNAVLKRKGDYLEAAGLVLEAMLQSPRFIYRMEDERNGPGVDPYELASRLSYILWGGPPDKELFRAAAAGELTNSDLLKEQVARMLKDPWTIDHSSRFIYEWLNLGRLSNLRPSPGKFPHWDSQIAADMREETLAFFREVAWEQELPLTSLLNAEFTFATPRLAAHYGLKREPRPGRTEQSFTRDETPARVSKGLQVLYTFQDGVGQTVRDLAPQSANSLLQIEPAAAVDWGAGWLRVTEPALISGSEPPRKLIETLKKSKEITLEVWITPADDQQTGPARVLTLSSGPSNRNFTVGQDGNKFEIRFRTTKTDANGHPALASQPGSAAARLTHLVYTRNEAGKALLFVDGEIAAEREVPGDLGNWEDNYQLALANETSRDRPWRGTYHLVAIYDRALNPSEIHRNFQVGPREEADLFLAGATFGAKDVEGLEALYTFEEGNGAIVKDRSSHANHLHLKGEDASLLKWANGGLQLEKGAKLANQTSAARLADAIRQTGALTIEAWLTPANTSQKGPARIVTFSEGTGERNFTLGQEEDQFQVRFRTSSTDANGLPGLSTPKGSVERRLTHLLFTRNAEGITRLYLDGQEVAAGESRGSLEPWQKNFTFALGNETTADRPWEGTIHLVAIYSRALRPDEVQFRGTGLSRYDLASIPSRGGLLTQGSILTVGGDEASMVARGLFLLHDILDGKVEDPPPCVDTTPVPTKPGLSQRAIALQRLSNQACTACHSKFEPLAFGLEKFDGLGAFHEVDEHGNKLREDGEILFPGTAEPVAFHTSEEMMDLLARSSRVREVIARKLIQFALGRPLVESDGPAVRRILEATVKEGGTYAGLISAIVLSDLVRGTTTDQTINKTES